MSGQKNERAMGGAKSNQASHKGSAVNATSAAIEHYVRGVDYPTSKQDLIEMARQNNAPNDIMAIIKQFEDKDYQNATDISRELGRVN